LDREIDLAIHEIYKKKLFRIADPEGLEFWSNKVKSGDLSIEELSNKIESGEEFKKLKENHFSLKKPPMEVINKIGNINDRKTVHVMSKILKIDSNCIDIGAHKGDILRKILVYAPLGKHLAFEPIPELYEKLQEKFPMVKIYDYALSNEKGDSTFYHVKNLPSHSGLKKRKYLIDDPIISRINVKTNLLDNFLEKTNEKIDFIKIDVEGAEKLVIEGGLKTLRRDKPYIIFECGKGSTENYGTTAKNMYELICSKIGLKISLLDDWLNNRNSLSLAEFKNQFDRGQIFYFLAHP